MVDKQETALAKIGGKLSEIALALNQVKSPRSCEKPVFITKLSLKKPETEFEKLLKKHLIMLHCFRTVHPNQLL